MFRKTLLALCCGLALWGLPGAAALAAVDINRADEAALTGLKGIGPALAHRIVQAREKDGAFRDAGDLTARVKGMGPKLVARLQQEGLAFSSPAAKAGRAVPGGPLQKFQTPAKLSSGARGEVKAAAH
ncbi:ComEA family DNA-binding protein [Paracidovorax citrulli]